MSRTQGILYFCIHHFYVDFISTIVLISFFNSQTSSISVMEGILIYNFLAFAMQLPLGILLDSFRKYKECLLLANLLLILGLLITRINPIFAVCLVSFANALAHLVGGSYVLSESDSKSGSLGIYIAPGALGLYMGNLLFTNTPNLHVYAIIAFLVIVTSLLLVQKLHFPSSKTDFAPLKLSINYFSFIIMFLCLTIVLRSLVGSALFFPWKLLGLYPLLLTSSVFLGKSIGGYLGDKFGMIKVGVVSLLLSSIFLYLGFKIPVCGVIGIVLFQMTTAITLFSLNVIIKNRPGLVFGINCFCLYMGYLLMFVPLNYLFVLPVFILILTLLASFSLLNSFLLFKLEKRVFEH